MPALLALIAALGGVAVWRRKTIREDAQRLNSAARTTVAGIRSGRKDLLMELGERTYARSTGDEDSDNEAEISRLIGELVQIDAASKEEEPVSGVDAAV